MTLTAIDLFCGVGGLTHGFIKESISVIAGIDADQSCKFAFEANNPGAQFLKRDVGVLSATELDQLFPKGATRILAGCAPCQPFSRYTRRKSPDEKWKLVSTFADLAIASRPEIVTMENVIQLQNHAVFKRFVKRLELAGYCVTYFTARGPEYGIPQSRTRLVVFASLFGPIDIVGPTHDASRRPNLRGAIGNLPQLKAGGVCATDSLHRCRDLSPVNLRRIQAATPGGFWHDWPEELKLRCHKKKSGHTYRSVYGRMSWDEPSPVVTTQFIGLGNGRFGHPEQDRALSLREGALLQTFPKSYVFIDPRAKRISMHAIARQIGNAVPVTLGRIVARSIKRHVRAFQ